jgi:hypothetical protein
MFLGGPDKIPGGLDRTRRWNLRTWPLEWVQWANDNSHRLDVVYQKDQGGQNQGDPRDPPLLRTPLPNNERNQFRWNGPAYGAGDRSAGIDRGQLVHWAGLPPRPTPPHPCSEAKDIFMNAMGVFSWALVHLLDSLRGGMASAGRGQGRGV